MNLSAPNRRKKATILVAEDESIVRADIEDHLKSFGYRVVASVATGREARRLANQLRPDLALLDIILAGEVDGIQAGKYIQKKLGIPVVFVTAHGDEHTLERAKLNAPFGYVLKPFNERDLRTAVEIAIFRHRTEEELRRLQQWLKAILDNMPEAVVVTDKWGFVMLLNERATALTGCTGKKALGKALEEIVQLRHASSGEPLRHPLDEAGLLSDGKGKKNHYMLVAAGGLATPVQVAMVPMAGSAGEITGTILKFQPINN